MFVEIDTKLQNKIQKRGRYGKYIKNNSPTYKEDLCQTISSMIEMRVNRFLRSSLG